MREKIVIIGAGSQGFTQGLVSDLIHQDWDCELGLVDIARDVQDLAPDALFFNYGNPMAPVCRGVRKATGAEMTGLCHGVFHVAHYLEEILGLARNDLDYKAIGMNHLTWFTEIKVDGQDQLPRLKEIAAAVRERGVNREKLGENFAEAGTDDEISTAEKSPFSWQLLDLFDAFPAVLDRHVVEFSPLCFAGREVTSAKRWGSMPSVLKTAFPGGIRILRK